MDNYNDTSIRSLKGADRVRKRPGVMLGSDGIDGAFHTVKELVGNSMDEFRAGYGGVLDLILHKDNSFTLTDDGRGVPMAWNEKEGRYNWDLIFNELYAGGKYDDDSENYKYSVGLNGLGATATQYTSEFFDVISFHKDKIFKKSFKRGEPTEDELEVCENTTGVTGTTIHWKLDDTVFTDTAVTFKMLIEYCEGQAHVNSVTFKLLNEATGERVLFEGKGIEAYLIEKLDGTVVDVLRNESKAKGMEKNNKYECKCEVALVITEETNSKKMLFHNTASMSTGVHSMAVNNAITHFFKDLGKQNGVSISEYDYKDYISIVVSSYSNITSFENQTKNGISNLFIYNLIYDAIDEMLSKAVAMGKESVTDLMSNVLTAALARKKAKEIEAQERQIKKTIKRREKADKFVDCRSKKACEKELFIVEGDSALGSCKVARDGKTQALLPIKGKIVNCLKKDLDEILKNQEVKDIINTIGCAPDIGTSGDELFNVNDLKVSKIIFCTDADVDGFQIRVLLYTLFVRLYPQLLEQGYVYVVETPLFEIVTSKGIEFAYSVEEKDRIQRDLMEKGIAVKRVNRSKGLGENDPEMLWDTTMNPETRKLVQLNIDFRDQIVRDISEMLFGDDKSSERKDFIFGMLCESDMLDLVKAAESISAIPETE